MMQIHEQDIEALVDIVTVDCKQGHNPSLYKRGDVWRYHLDRFGNQWEDGKHPVNAALLVERDYYIHDEIIKLRKS